MRKIEVILVLALVVLGAFAAYFGVFSGYVVSEGFSCGDYINRTPFVSVASGEVGGGHESQKAADSDQLTYWESPVSDETWIYFDLLAERCIRKVSLDLNPEFTPRVMDVEVSDDLITWKTIVSDWTGSPWEETYVKSFPETEGRYVRVNFQPDSSDAQGNPQSSGSLQEVVIEIALRTEDPVEEVIVPEEVPDVVPDVVEPVVPDVVPDVVEPAIADVVEPVVVDESFCIDNDEGLDYETAGWVSTELELYNDECISNSELVENYCLNGIPSNETRTCEYACESGKCVPYVPDLSESCFLLMDFIEETSGEGSQFSLAEIRNVFGDFTSEPEHSAEIFSNYILKTYDSEGLEIKGYAIPSVLTIHSELFPGAPDEDLEAEPIELQSGVISSTIPYDPEIDRLGMDNLGDVTFFNVDFENLACERECRLPGESFTSSEESCCVGFSEIDTGNSYFCISCGDGICSRGESEFCSEDCAP